MSDWVILATGPSMSQAVADSMKGRNVIAVNDAYKLAPWANALVAQDHEWWNVHTDAWKFQGRKFSTNKIQNVEKVDGASGTSSGAIAVQIAATVLGAKRVLLFGFDMHGTHYFGQHPSPLNNTSQQRFGVFQQQFEAQAERCKKMGVKVLNCTPGSALKAFPFAWDPQ